MLPLLQAETVQTGLVEPGAFLAGYGAAQAVPGPLFTFSAFLGAVTTSGPSGRSEHRSPSSRSSSPRPSSSSAYCRSGIGCAEPRGCSER
ncbi:chromate transporter [Microbacterium sp. NPDC003461]